MIQGEVGLGQGRCAVSSKMEDKLMIGMRAYCESDRNALNSNKLTKVQAQRGNCTMALVKEFVPTHPFDQMNNLYTILTIFS